MRRSRWSELDRVFSAVAPEMTVYVPQNDGPVTKFAPWTEGCALSGVTLVEKSPKELFFPQSENLMAFRMAQKKIEILDTRRETEDFVLFGVRACDVRALTVLDNVFLAEPVDTYYENRRRHGVIVSLACDRPMGSCFCGTFGIDAAEPEGDVVCHRADDMLYWDAKTAKGEEFLAKIGPYTEDADADDEKAVEERRARDCRRPVSAAAPAPLSARPASATTSAISTADAGCCATGAGTRACTRTSPKCPPDSRVSRRRSGSASGSCTSWYIIRRTTMGCTAVSAAADA